MISRYIVTLNGISLESIHPAIVVSDVRYPPVSYERESIGIVNRDGARIHRSYKEKSEVTVAFVIREYDIYNRQLICQEVCKWAKDGGRLMINDRPLQFLDCIVDSFPAVESTRGWTEELTITFAAYGIPYWQDLIQTTIAPAAGTSKAVSSQVPGNAQWTLVEATITPSATLTSIEIDVNSTRHNLTHQKFTLSGMSVPANSVVTITYDENAALKVYRGTSTNLLRYHAGKDDLQAACGMANNFNYSANCSCTVVYKLRGNYE